MAKTYHPGERFTPDPGTKVKMRCGICDSIMDVKRNKYGPRSWAAAMAGHKSAYDEFTCPHAGKDWHEQARLLKAEIEETASAVMADMMRLELFDIIQRREPTR